MLCFDGFALLTAFLDKCSLVKYQRFYRLLPSSRGTDIETANDRISASLKDRNEAQNRGTYLAAVLLLTTIKLPIGGV